MIKLYLVCSIYSNHLPDKLLWTSNTDNDVYCPRGLYMTARILYIDLETAWDIGEPWEQIPQKAVCFISSSGGGLLREYYMRLPDARLSTRLPPSLGYCKFFLICAAASFEQHNSNGMIVKILDNGLMFVFWIYIYIFPVFTLGLYPNNVSESVSWWVGRVVRPSIPMF